MSGNHKHSFKGSEFMAETRQIEILLNLVNAETRRLSESEKARDHADLERLRKTLNDIYWKMREQLFK